MPDTGVPIPEAVVQVAGCDEPLRYRLIGEDQNLNLALDPIEAKALRELDPVHLDLLEIASIVLAADGAVPRGGETRPHMGSEWTRQFDFSIPVRMPELWSLPEVNRTLVEAVEILTDDSVSFRFTPRAPELNRQSYLQFDPKGVAFEADEVILFSGGLDSFAGALEVLSTMSSRVVLVTHRSAQKAIPRQVELGKYLASRFKDRVLHVHVVARRIGEEASDWNQRSRSFLFAALGQVVAQVFGAQKVSFFENGIVSHNLPVSSQIVSTMASRTTHPLALRKLDQLMKLLLPDPAPTGNRYQWMTKSEVISRILQYGAEAQISLAVSCTSIRVQEKGRTHCGACTQCFDRRFAVLAAGLAKYDPDESYITDVLFGERRDEDSITMAVEWPRHMRALGGLEELVLFVEFGLEASRILRGHPEVPRQTAVDLMLKMYRRQSDAVHAVLRKATSERANDLAHQRLPATSLICLHLGRSTELPKTPRVAPQRLADLDEIEEVDAVPRPEAPLRVKFLEEAGRYIVDVVGIGTVRGQPARVPHALKPAFDEDRSRDLDPMDHRYLLAVGLPLLEGQSKRAIRKSIERCRESLADDYERVFGKRPDRHLLIETKPSKGYRLDPDIDVVDSNH